MSFGIDAISSLGALATPIPEVKSDADPSEQMEILFAKILLKEVRKSMPKDGLMSGPAIDMFQGLFDDLLAEQFAAAGGFGFAEQASRHISLAEKGSSSGWMSPLDGHRSSNFGDRIDPLNGSRRNHDGIDIAASAGTQIRAARKGRVVFSGQRGGYGNLVIVDHGNGLQTRYAHCQNLFAPVGRNVAAGEVIATVGSSGRSTGPHLHFEIHQDGLALNPDSILNWKTP